MSDNLLNDIIDITTKYCDAPKVFHIALAYHVISVTLGQFFEMPDLKCGRPNVWFVLSCIPGRGRRSTIMNYNYKFLYSSFEEFYIQIKKFEKKNAGINVIKSIIEDGTSQGVCDSIIEGLDSGLKVFMLCSSEFGDILKRITSDKHYTSGMDTLLSRLYYGEYYKESLSQRRKGNASRFIPEGLYFSMFASMQEPQHYLTRKMSTQGLLRRMRIIYVKASDFSMDDWKPPIQDKFNNYKKEMNLLIKKKLVPRMIKYYTMLEKKRKTIDIYGSNNPFLRVDIDSSTRIKISNMARKIDEDVINDPSDYNVYQQTRWEHVTKYAILNAISEDNWIAEDYIYCEQRHFDESLNFDDIIDKHTMEMMDNIGLTERHIIDETMLERIDRKIRKAGPEGIKRSDLLNSLPGVKADELTGLIDTLRTQEKIEELQTDARRRGRIGTIYVSSNFNS